MGGPNARFIAGWQPRIGDEATVVGWRYSVYSLAMAPAVIGGGIGASFAFSGHIIWAGVVLCLFDVGVICGWLRMRLALARAISAYLHLKVTLNQLPNMRYKTFDKWLAERKSEAAP